MKDSWKGKNINLSLLTDRIMQFFILKGFKVSLKKKKGKYSIIAIPQRFHEITEKVSVNVLGESDNFTIEFVAGSFSRALVLHAPFLSLILGGYLVKKGITSLEKLEALEKEFWSYVDETILFLESIR